MAKRQDAGKASRAKAAGGDSVETAPRAKPRARAGQAGLQAVTGGEKLESKAYLKALKKLRVEPVKTQQWVRQKGLKVCIVFGGRDGAGKGARSRRSPSGSARACSATS